MNVRYPAPALLLGVLASLGVHLVLFGIDGGDSDVSPAGAVLPVELVAVTKDPPAAVAVADPAPLSAAPAVSRPRRTSQAGLATPLPETGMRVRRETRREKPAPKSVAVSQAEVDPVRREESEMVETPPAAGLSVCTAPAAAQKLMAEASGQSALSSGSAAESVDSSVVVDRGFPPLQIAPRYRFAPSPSYPAMARSRGWEGNVEIWVRVAEDGWVLEARVHDTSGYELLDRAAVDAVRRWRFHPARVGPTAVATEVRVPVCFRLSN